MYRKVEHCRICGNTDLTTVLDLGEQMLTGVFPEAIDKSITTGPLRLVKCTGKDDVCGLLQLEHSYDLGEMYGENYGYRSGLNASMVEHLHGKVKRIYEIVNIESGDLIIDIGSNDSTTLQAYDTNDIDLVGIDPTGIKFSEYYPQNIKLIPEFFSAELIRKEYPGRKAKVITSFSMFYDLENPMSFMQQIHDILADDGIWVFEQSYMPKMLEMNSYDTVCHEHLEYYSLHQIKWMTDRIGFHILDVQFNDINGGSFSVTVTKSDKKYKLSDKVNKILNMENELGLHTLEPYRRFAKRVEDTRRQLRNFFDQAKSEDKVVMAIGASTKGNVILQYCNVDKSDIEYIGEVNNEKINCFTPGTWIPIISEDEVLSKNPDYLLILPWHFKNFFLESKKFKGQKLVTPLPNVSVLS